MEMQRTTQGQNVNVTMQILHSQPTTHVVDAFQQRVRLLTQDGGNIKVIQEMEEELALWVIRAITYFLLALLFYIDLEYPLPYEVLFLLPLISDVLHFLFYLRKMRAAEY